MSETVQADDGAMLPLDSIPQTFTYSGSFVQTITVTYAGETYEQYFGNNGTNIIYISGWMNIMGAPIPNNEFLANISGGTAQAVGNTLSDFLDSAVDNSQGDILYRNASVWTYLPAGTSGQVLTTGGASGNPSWTDASLTPIANNDMIANISGSTAAPVGVTVTSVLDAAFGNVQGDMLYRNATGWVVLAPGSAGQILVSGGSAANPSWGDSAVVPIANNTILANISGSTAAPVGDSISAILDSTIDNTQGDLLYRNGSSWVALTHGTAGQILSTGGVAANPGWINNTGLTASANNLVIANISGGSAIPIPVSLSAIIDSSIGAVQGEVLYRGSAGWSALAPGAAGTLLSSGGASANPSWITNAAAPIADHTLLANTSGSTAVPVSTTLTALIDNAIGNVQGDLLYRNSTGWVVLPPGSAGQILSTGGAAANPSWIQNNGWVYQIVTSTTQIPIPQNVNIVYGVALSYGNYANFLLPQNTSGQNGQIIKIVGQTGGWQVNCGGLSGVQRIFYNQFQSTGGPSGYIKSPGAAISQCCNAELTFIGGSSGNVVCNVTNYSGYAALIVN